MTPDSSGEYYLHTCYLSTVFMYSNFVLRPCKPNY